MVELLHIEPSDRLVFEVIPGEVAKTVLRLTSKHTENLAFKVEIHRKIKTTAAESYFVSPSKGIIEPGQDKVISLTLKPLSTSITQINHKFNVVYAPTRLTVSQESGLNTFWPAAKEITQSIVLQVHLRRVLDRSLSSISSESLPGDVTREYKKLMDFNKQQNDEKRELELQLSMLKRLYEERQEKDVRPGQKQAIGLFHLIMSVLIGLVTGVLLFKAS